VSCGICYEVCPGIKVDFGLLKRQMEFSDIFKNDLELGSFSKCYLSCAKDDSVQQQGASGGVVTSLLIYLMEKKLVDGVILVNEKEDQSWLLQVIISENVEEIKQSAGSKYTMLSLLSVIEKVEKTGKIMQ
jgi:coenzyme F420 hydrogenase subunit beta